MPAVDKWVFNLLYYTETKLIIRRPQMLNLSVIRYVLFKSKRFFKVDAATPIEENEKKYAQPPKQTNGKHIFCIGIGARCYFIHGQSK